MCFFFVIYILVYEYVDLCRSLWIWGVEACVVPMELCMVLCVRFWLCWSFQSLFEPKIKQIQTVGT